MENIIFEWDENKIPTISEVIMLNDDEYASTAANDLQKYINSLDVKEAKTTLMGTKAGADMNDGLTINGEDHGLLYEKKVELETGGVDFYDGTGDDPALKEAESWYAAVVNDTEPLVKPEQALVVTQILEGIYKSAKTGEPVYL